MMRHGIVQGSILGPLLFLIYINDLPAAAPECNLVIYADDSALSTKSRTQDGAIEEMRVYGDKANEWFVSNRLTANQDKTENIHFTLKKDNAIETKTIKFLGVTLDSKLTFEEHVNIISKKLCSATYVLRNLSKIVDKDTSLIAYHGLFHSVCVYGLLTWGHSAHAPRVFGLQRRAVRIVAGLGYRDDARPAFQSLKILTLPSQYILESLLFFHQNAENYVTGQDVHEYHTRNRENIRPNFSRLKTSCNATRHFAPVFFNKLPQGLRALPFAKFKYKIKRFLVCKCFYSKEEFLQCHLTDLDFQ